jgi:ribosomal protein S18 acetylase RimI-like enzyme
MTPEDVPQVSDLIVRVFDEFIAPEYVVEGVREFLKYVTPEALLKRSQADHFALVATESDQIVGMIEIRHNDHISLLFVDKAFQGRGIARELWQRALGICRSNQPELKQVTVNSSPYAVPIYEKLGFQPQGEQRVTNGIAYVPMVIDPPG